MKRSIGFAPRTTMIAVSAALAMAGPTYSAPSFAKSSGSGLPSTVSGISASDKQQGAKAHPELLAEFGEAGAGGFQPVEIALQLGGVGRGVEVAQVPFGEGAEGFAARGVGVADGEGEMEHRLSSGLPAGYLVCRRRDHNRGA